MLVLFNLDGYVSENRYWQGVGGGVWRKKRGGGGNFSEAAKTEIFVGCANGAVKQTISLEESRVQD